MILTKICASASLSTSLRRWHALHHGFIPQISNVGGVLVHLSKPSWAIIEPKALLLEEQGFFRNCLYLMKIKEQTRKLAMWLKQTLF